VWKKVKAQDHVKNTIIPQKYGFYELPLDLARRMEGT
jgi:hypothetical protein